MLWSVLSLKLTLLPNHLITNYSECGHEDKSEYKTTAPVMNQ